MTKRRKREKRWTVRPGKVRRLVLVAERGRQVKKRRKRAKSAEHLPTCATCLMRGEGLTAVREITQVQGVALCATEGGCDGSRTATVKVEGYAATRQG